MKKIDVYLKIEHEKITCMCMRSAKRCKRYCEKDSVLYDQYKEVEECLKNNKEVHYHG